MISVIKLSAIEYSIEKGLNLYRELTEAVEPINIANIRLFSDSTIALSWIQKSEILFFKREKRTVYVNHRIDSIVTKYREIHTVHFSHVGSSLNSADFVTKEFSSKRLGKISFISGPPVLKKFFQEIDWIICPNRNVDNTLKIPEFTLNKLTIDNGHIVNYSKIINFDKYSSVNRAVKTLIVIGNFVNLLKSEILTKRSHKIFSLQCP